MRVPVIFVILSPISCRDTNILLDSLPILFYHSTALPIAVSSPNLLGRGKAKKKQFRILQRGTMQSTTSAATRGLSVIIFLFLLSNALDGQIKIKERLEINPKSSRLLHASTSSSDLPYLSGSINPGRGDYDPKDYSQSFSVLRPCKIICTGTLDIPPTVPVDIIVNILGRGIANRTDSVEMNCGGVFCNLTNLTSCGNFFDVIVGGNISDKFITYTFSGNWCCWYPNVVPFSATVTFQAIPIQHDPVTCVMSATDTVLDYYKNAYNCISCSECDSTCYQLHSGVNAEWDDDTGNPFAYCCTTVLFTIEKPVHGLYFTWTDSAAHKGTSYEAAYCGGIIPARFTWDGSDLPDDTCQIIIRADGLGLSTEKKICLKKPLPYYFDVIPANSTISAGQATAITVIGRDIQGLESSLNGSKSVTLSGVGSFIVGSDTIPKQAIVTYDMARNGDVKYLPGMSDFIDEGIATISVCRTDYPERSGYGSIDVMPACPLDSLSKSKISPGDTIIVKIMAQTENGVFPYSSDQNFIVSMDADERSGKLHCIATCDSGTTITGTQPFEFIAADKINVDSIVVNISAYPVRNGGGGGGGGIGSIKDGQKDTLQRHLGLMSEKQIKPVGINALLNIDGTKNVLVSPQASFTKKLAEQNNVFAQKAASKQALMNAITEAIKTQRAGKSNAVSAKQLNAMVQDLADGNLCMLFATLTIEGIELEVDTPNEDQIIEGNQPPVWTKPIKARLVNFKKGNVTFYWKMKVEWNGLGGIYTPIIDHIYQNDDPPKTGTNDNWVDLGIQINNPLLGGDQITLYVRAVADNGNTYETNPIWKEIFQIKGRNPSKTAILTQLGDLKYKVIAFQESKFNHFHAHGNPSKVDNQSPYFPFQGGDVHDIGIMQINNPGSDAIIWDWTVNIATGKSIFDEKYSLAGSYYLDIRNGKTKAVNADGGFDYRQPDPNDDQGNRDTWYYCDEDGDPNIFNAQPMTGDQQLSEAFQRYNKHTYWKWVPDVDKNPSGPGKWLAYPPNPINDDHTLSYGDECWRLYTNPPSDWK
jgi:hypothetical protein